jgi:tetratricopeptide (TPR) repeat protein
MNGNDADAYYSLGLAYYRQGKLDEALSQYKESLRIDTNYAPAHYTLALYSVKANACYSHSVLQKFGYLPKYIGMIKV